MNQPRPKRVLAFVSVGSERPTEHASDAAPPTGPAWKAALAYGIDMSLLERNLALSVEERLEQLQSMQRLFELLRPAESRDAEHA